VSSDALDRYAVMFSSPLTAAQIKALAALFGWSPPADQAILGEGIRCCLPGWLCSYCSMDPSSILFWNVRGLNSSTWQDVVRNLVVSSKIDVVCL
jgi:hypothetical protein